jgi:PAS domain S-box-containing protein
MGTETLRAENAELRCRLQEAEDTVRAIQQGAVDAFVIEELAGHRVYTLVGADRPYRLFVEQMQQGVATLHADGTIVYCNQQLADLLRLPHERLIGAALNEFVVAEDHLAYVNLLSQGQARSSRGEVRLRREDGVLLPALLTFHLLPRDCDAMVGVFITDMTTQKYHEQLVAAQQELRDSDRRKNEFLAMLAHELRNPLAPIRNAMQVLCLDRADREMIRSACDMMNRQVDHVVRLVDDLMDVSRISQGKMQLRKEQLELQAVVKQVEEVARASCEDKELELALCLPPKTLYLNGDRTRLVQAFGNLLSNACKFSPAGGRIQLSVEEEDGQAVIRVQDQGIGIASDHLPRVFEMFMQVNSSLERSEGGLGIGLTLVQRIVELHDGKVTAHSSGLGQGSEFIVRLPLASEPSPPRTSLHPAGGERPPAHRRRILIVDDNRDSADSFAMLLRLSGHDVHLAYDGLEAVEAAESTNPDLVLLDIGLPRLNGYEAARKIRAQPWGQRPILVAMTGWGQDEDRCRAAEAGFNEHLVKPLDLDVLMDLVARSGAAGHAAGKLRQAPDKSSVLPPAR